MTIEELLGKRNATIINIEKQVETISLSKNNYQYGDCDCGNCGDCACFCECDCGYCDGFYKEVIS